MSSVACGVAYGVIGWDGAGSAIAIEVGGEAGTGIGDGTGVGIVIAHHAPPHYAAPRHATPHHTTQHHSTPHRKPTPHVHRPLHIREAPCPGAAPLHGLHPRLCMPGVPTARRV